MDNQIYMVRQKKGDKANLFNSFEQILNKNFSIMTLWWYVRNRKLVEVVPKRCQKIMQKRGFKQRIFAIYIRAVI